MQITDNNNRITSSSTKRTKNKKRANARKARQEAKVAGNPLTKSIDKILDTIKGTDVKVTSETAINERQLFAAVVHQRLDEKSPDRKSVV